MKKLFAALILACGLTLAGSSALAAQTPALSMWGGWKWGGSMGIAQGDLSAEAAPNYGVELSVPARPGASVIFLVDYQPTTLRLKQFNTGIEEDVFDMDIWYFMAGGQAEMPGNGRVVPFGTFAIGVAWFDPGDDGLARESETMFTTLLGGGVRVPLGQSDRVALRLEARMHLNIPYGGTSLWCGTGGCYGGVGGYVGPVQGAVLGGRRFAHGGRPGAARGGRR